MICSHIILSGLIFSMNQLIWNRFSSFGHNDWMIQSQLSSWTTHRKERNKASFLTQSYHIDLEYLAYSRWVKWTTFHIFLVCFYFLFEAWKLQFPIENAWIITITVFKVFFQRSTEKRKVTWVFNNTNTTFFGELFM